MAFSGRDATAKSGSFLMAGWIRRTALLFTAQVPAFRLPSLSQSRVTFAIGDRCCQQGSLAGSGQAPLPPEMSRGQGCGPHKGS